jgi:hypothetical protein
VAGAVSDGLFKSDESRTLGGHAANSKAIADIARYQLGMAKGRIDPAMQAKLIRSDLKTLAKLQREHDAYFVELQRRNSQKRSRRKIKKGY